MIGNKNNHLIILITSFWIKFRNNVRHLTMQTLLTFTDNEKKLFIFWKSRDREILPNDGDTVHER